jgi:hypothetical protein
MRERCGAIDRRKTSLPPPGLECVISVTTVVRFVLAHEPIETAARSTARIRTGDWDTSAKYMTDVARVYGTTPIAPLR